MQGAHTLGENSDSIGVCLIGGMDKHGKADSNFTLHQYESLDSLKAHYHSLQVFGHRDFSPKDCPCFDAAEV